MEKKGEVLKLKNLNAMVKHGGEAFMVWGSMTWGLGFSNFAYTNRIMTEEKYLGILQGNPQDSAKKMGLGH